MSSFVIPFNLKIKEPKNSRLIIRIKPTDDYATLKEIFDKLTRRYNYHYEFQDDSEYWIFNITKLNNMYNTFVQDLTKLTKDYKIKSVTSYDKNNTSGLYIDFVLPSNHNLYGKYKMTKYGDPEYKGELKTVDYIIDKIMTETFHKNMSRHVYKVDKTRYGVGYDLFDLNKYSMNDWRQFYHKIYFLQQIFLDLNIMVKNSGPEYKQLAKCLQEPDLMFKGKFFIEFEYPRFNTSIDEELNKLMKKLVKRGSGSDESYFKDLPETTNYNEIRKFILKNNLTDKQMNELKQWVKKNKHYNVKIFINNKEIHI